MGDLKRLGDVIRMAERAQRFQSAGDMERRAEEEIRRESRQLRATRLEAAGMTGGLFDEVRESIIAGDGKYHSAIAVALFAWFRDPHRAPVLVVSGSIGIGKTVALAQLCAEYTAKFYSADQLSRLFTSNYSEHEAKRERSRNAQLLLVDDVGSEFERDKMIHTLLDVLEARQSAADTPTVITTNLTRKAFAEAYANGRVLSRMRRARWVSFSGEDRRKPK